MTGNEQTGEGGIPMRRFALPCFAAALWAGCAAPEAGPAHPGAAPAPEIVEQAAVDGVTVAGLSNGMTVIVQPRRTAPVVSVKAYVRAGGLYEDEWLGCGLSHLLEHLVADDAVHASQGGADYETEQAGPSRVDLIGAQANAYTSLDHTCYYVSAAAGKANECIDLVADWLARPQFTRADFEREHGVVQRELEKGRDEPSRQFWYTQARNVFGTHPGAVPVIGYPEPLARVTWDDVRAYHARMYAPQNMVFVVVGDVDVSAALERVRTAFAGFAAGRVPDLTLPEVEPFSGIRRVVREQKELEESICAISFQTIPLLHEDLYALDVLAYVLAEGNASRLHQRLFREQKLVTSISSSSWTPAWGKGIFDIDYRCAPDKADAAEQAVLAELRKVVADGVTEAELVRAKRQKTADWVYSQQTAESIASTLASDYLSTRDVRFSKHYADRIQGVTAEQVLAAARKHLTFDRVAMTRLVPEGSSRTATAGGAQGAPEGRVEAFTLDSGLRVVLRPADAGLVSMVYMVRGGVLAETESTNGLGTLMTALSTRGTKHYTAEEIDTFFDAAGGGIGGRCGNNTYYWQATTLKDRFDKSLDILADVILSPTFDERELQILRPAALAAIERAEEHWFSQLQKRFREEFFAGSPYRLLSAGRREVAAEASVEQLVTYHKEFIYDRPHDSVLTIYGEFDPTATRERLVRRFEAHGDPRKRLDVPAERPDPPRGMRVFKTDKTQAGIIVAAPGMRMTDLDDHIAMTVLDTIISGYHLPSGWLHNELRGKQLVYVVHAYNFAGLSPGAFLAYAACRPEKAPEVVGIMQGAFRRAANYKPTQAEIDLAVNSILTAELLGSQSMGDLAMDAAINEIYGLGHDFRHELEERYRAVTPDDVQRVARKYLTGGYVTVVTTPKPELLKAD